MRPSLTTENNEGHFVIYASSFKYQAWDKRLSHVSSPTSHCPDDGVERHDPRTNNVEDDDVQDAEESVEPAKSVGDAVSADEETAPDDKRINNLPDDSHPSA